MEKNKSTITCNNVMKNKGQDNIRIEFNRKWIELINNFEKTKSCITK